MKKYFLETERCLLREMNQEDAANIFRLNLHPDVFRFTTDPPFKSIAEAQEFLSNYDSYSRTGIGRWAIELKANNEFIGWSGLKYILDENEVDIGYRILPEFWGKGLAVETSTVCCNFGFHELGLTRIVARVHKTKHTLHKGNRKDGDGL
ncbi:MAG: GNAT family N-acetyltransferase [Bacteroidetes bacterium]|nr:GNAT family N-acetyltransferase [Bacteroidota bacterium]